MVFGTFDIFHPGHKNFLEQAREQGDYLIVVVARDKTVLFLKKYQTENNEDLRLKVIKNSVLADSVILGNKLNLKNKDNRQFDIIKEHQPDVICLGYDQKFFVDELRNSMKDIEIIKLRSYKPGIYKSSKLKK